MQVKLMLLVSLLIASFMLQAQSEKQDLGGTWVSQGQQETRTLTLQNNGKGEFLSEHSQGRCLAQLDVVIDGQFIMAAGVANNCQKKNNAVGFEFYCQQSTKNELRCNIRSKHQKSGNTKQGVELFKRL